jgi:hypothetical protein
MKWIWNLLCVGFGACKCVGLDGARRSAGILGCWFGLGLAAFEGGEGVGWLADPAVCDSSSRGKNYYKGEL